MENREDGIREEGGGKRGGVKLTPLFDLPPHFPDLAFLDLGRGGVEAADLVVLFVG